MSARRRAALIISAVLFRLEAAVSACRLVICCCFIISDPYLEGIVSKLYTAFDMLILYAPSALMLLVLLVWDLVSLHRFGKFRLISSACAIIYFFVQWMLLTCNLRGASLSVCQIISCLIPNLVTVAAVFEWELKS